MSVALRQPLLLYVCRIATDIIIVGLPHCGSRLCFCGGSHSVTALQILSVFTHLTFNRLISNSQRNIGHNAEHRIGVSPHFACG